MKNIVYVDMDGVLVDFMSAVEASPLDIRTEYTEYLDDVPNVLANVKLLLDAAKAEKKVYEHCNI